MTPRGRQILKQQDVFHEELDAAREAERAAQLSQARALELQALEIAEEQEKRLKEVEAERQEYARQEDERFGEERARIAKIEQSAEEAASQKLDSGRLWKRGDTADKVFGGIAVAFSVIAGGVGGAMTGDRGNVALDIINNAIEQDIEEQKFNIGQAWKKVDAQRGILHDLQQMWGDKHISNLHARELSLKAALQRVEAMKARHGITNQLEAVNVMEAGLRRQEAEYRDERKKLAEQQARQEAQQAAAAAAARRGEEKKEWLRQLELAKEVRTGSSATAEEKQAAWDLSNMSFDQWRALKNPVIGRQAEETKRAAQKIIADGVSSPEQKAAAQEVVQRADYLLNLHRVATAGVRSAGGGDDYDSLSEEDKKQLPHISAEMRKEGVPDMDAALQNADLVINKKSPPSPALKQVISALQAATSSGLFGEAAAQEVLKGVTDPKEVQQAQAVLAVYNRRLKQLSGSGVSMAEASRSAAEVFGDGSPEAILRGIKQVKEENESRRRSVNSGFSPRVQKYYGSRTKSESKGSTTPPPAVGRPETPGSK